MMIKQRERERERERERQQLGPKTTIYLVVFSKAF